MASFNDHILQANENISFLQQMNLQLKPRNCGWEVVVCYYIAVHLMNAHITDKLNQTFNSHNKVNTVLFYDKHSPALITKQAFYAYKDLTRLSRIARYLFDIQAPQNKMIISAQHHQEAFVHLNNLIHYFNTLYPVININSVLYS